MSNEIFSAGFFMFTFRKIKSRFLASVTQRTEKLRPEYSVRFMGYQSGIRWRIVTDQFQCKLARPMMLVATGSGYFF